MICLIEGFELFTYLLYLNYYNSICAHTKILSPSASQQYKVQISPKVLSAPETRKLKGSYLKVLPNLHRNILLFLIDFIMK